MVTETKMNVKQIVISRLHDTSIRFGAGSSSAARVKLARCDPHRFENLDLYDVNKYRARKGNRKELVPVGRTYWYT